ncbi:MAG: riboflavin synthase [Pseudomonadota bacterium]
MFTGLIRTQGTLRTIDTRGDTVMTIAPAVMFPLSIGASVACHGMCLTVTSFTDSDFTVCLSAETIACTNAGAWKVGSILNLEPALAVGDAMGGHFVSGHVDGLARVTRREASGDATLWEFEVPPALARFIAPKGSVTLDGVSLTVNEVTGARFTVMIIPHTAAVTGFGTLAVGDTVNLEIDMLARYVARLMESAA